MRPLVSIIIPTYNRAHLIGETLDSVLAQTFQDWECIVVDDGSTDYTDVLLEFYCEKDARMQYYQRPEGHAKGANACRNLGFQLSKGEYIQWLDSDDMLGLNKIELQVKELKRNSSFNIATCKFGYVNRNFSKAPNIRENLMTYKNFQEGYDLLNCFGEYSEYFPPHVYLTKRNYISEAGFWNESLTINQDGEFFTRVLLIPGSIVFVQTVVLYRVNMKSNVSQLNSSEKALDLIKSWKLIDLHLEQEGKERKNTYLENGKNNIYKKIRKKYPKLIAANYDFFKSVLPLYRRIIYRL